MWVLLFPVLALVYLIGLFCVLAVKCLIALAYCLIAVVAWSAKVVIRYTT